MQLVLWELRRVIYLGMQWADSWSGPSSLSRSSPSDEDGKAFQTDKTACSKAGKHVQEGWGSEPVKKSQVGEIRLV